LIESVFFSKFHSEEGMRFDSTHSNKKKERYIKKSFVTAVSINNKKQS
jgi:hypothetical protein